jgi:hypothetical protein
MAAEPVMLDNGWARKPDKIRHTMKPRLLFSLLSLLLVFSAGQAWSDERWRELPPEERRELRQQMREHWRRENVAPQQSTIDENVPRKRDLSPDERRRLRDELRERHGREERPGKNRQNID